MSGHKFNIKKLEKLNNPHRTNMIDLEKIVENLKLRDNSLLVDIGAGTGVFSEKLLELIPKSNCYALDISREMIDWINLNRTPRLHGRLKASVMEESSIPLKENLADVVFMITVHHELDDAIVLLKDARRVLNEDGKILICDWKEGSHKHFVKKDKIVNDLKEAGFEDIQEIDASEDLVCLIGY